jgi:putative transcriptional regulator
MVRVSLKRSIFDIAITRRNLSQKELARELGISRALLSQVVGGKKEPSAMMRKRLLEYFQEYSFDDLFNIEEGDNDDRGKA